MSCFTTEFILLLHVILKKCRQVILSEIICKRQLDEKEICYTEDELELHYILCGLREFDPTIYQELCQWCDKLIDENGETLEQVSITANSENSFNKTISIPKTDGSSIGVDVYTGDKPYGQFESWAYNYVKLVRDGNGGWVIEQSPVFEHNKAMYEKDKSIKEALKYTASIQSNSDSIISIAEQLTADKTTDYEKVLALHDWICSYMYYDIDSLASDEAPPYYATDIVKSRKAVCLGFATLMASLCRSIDIPCNVVSGYALGVGNDTAWTDISIATDEQNHAWNEVYIDGRWMIVDATWDCANKIENGEMNKGEVSHLYFDANLQFFSNNHKILEYSKRR